MAGLIGAARFRSFGPRVHHRHHVRHGPKRLVDPRRHGRAAPERLVHPAEIVPDRVKRDHVKVRFRFLAEPVRQPREPTHLHPHREVGAFNVGRADVSGVRATLDPNFLDTGAFGGAVAAGGASRFTIQFDQLGIVDIGAERPFDRFKIALQAIRGHLDPGGETGRHVLHELMGVPGIPSADQIGHDQLAVGIQRGPSPKVAGLGRGRLRGRDVLLLTVAESPYFIALHPLGCHAPDGLIMDRKAGFAGFRQYLGHRVDAHIRDA